MLCWVRTFFLVALLLFLDGQGLRSWAMLPSERGQIVADSLNQMELARLFTERKARILKDAVEVSDGERDKQGLSQHSALTVHGQFMQLFARHLYGSDRASSIKSQFDLNMSQKFSDQFRYVISGRTYYDAAYDLGYYSKNAASDQKYKLELRDMYVDLSAADWDIRLGKQKIVWGEAIGSFVADAVNAKDFRNNLLDEFEEMRIPEWGIDVEYSKNDLHWEALAIPVPEFDRFGVDGAPFAVPVGVPQGTAYTRPDPKKPSGFKNAKLGARLSYLLDGFDLGVFYLNSWTHSPVEFRTINPDGSIDFIPAYQRLHSLGSTLSKEFGANVLRAEVVYNIGNYFSVSDMADADGIIRSDEMTYVVGVDRTILDNLTMAVQFQRHLIMDYQHDIVNQRRMEDVSMLRIARPFLNRTLESAFLLSASLNSPDFLYQPSLKYIISDAWQAKIGLDVFAGHAANAFGYFKPQSRYYTALIHKF